MPSYPSAIWHPSPNFRAGRRDIVNFVVLHTTEGGLEGSLRTLTDDASDNRVSAHYVVAPNGTVYALVRDEDEAWHARDSNMESIGIEVVGHADDPGTWTPAVVASLGNLVGWLSSTYNLPLTYRARTADPPAGFVAHAALDPSRRGDPGPWFPWADVKAQAEREQGSRALWPLAIVGGLAAWLLLR